MKKPTRTAPPEPVPFTQIIQVQVDLDRHSLKVVPPRLTVRPGDQVMWQFFSLPQNIWSVQILFDPNDQSQAAMGPFPRLSQGGNTVWSEVPANAADTTFTYRAVLEKRSSGDPDAGFARIHSQRATLLVESAATAAARQDTANPTVVHVEPTGTTGELVIVPPYVRLHAGDAVTWIFAPSILAGSNSGPLKPGIQFINYQGEFESPNLGTGPFTTLSHTPDTVTGTGYAWRPGYYAYRAVAVRQSDGEIVWASSPDPVLDDRGDPPDG